MAILAYRQRLISEGIARARALLEDRNRLLVAVGWQLSPFTEYNDPVVNIPLAGLMASLLRALFGWHLKQTFIPCYWFTNALGILLLVVGLRGSGRALVVRKAEIVRLASVTAAFSLILFLVGKLF
jgi:hypothetical protein